MKKAAFSYVGMALSLIGLFLIIKSLTITGFAVLGVLTNITIYIFPLVLFIGGILITITGDGLQAYLEKKEKEKASPSLEGKVQTMAEKMEFMGQYSKSYNPFKRLFGKKVEQVEQNSGKYTDGTANLQQEEYPSWEYKRDRDLTPDQISEKAERKRIEKDYFKHEKENIDREEEIKKIRNKMISLKKYMDEHPNINRLNEYAGNALHLKKLYDQAAMPFQIKGHLRIALKKQREAFDKGEYLKRAPEDFSRLDDMNKVAQEYGLENESTLSEKEANEMYIRDAQTASVQEVLDKYPVRIIHTIPLGSGIGKRGAATYALDKQIIKNSRGVEPEKFEDPVFEDFLKIVSSGKGILSANAESKKFDLSTGGAGWGNSYIGAIIKTGRIYNAGIGDATSLTNQYGLRIGNSQGNSTIKDSTNRAMEEIAKMGEGRHNEVFVGDYALDGFYVPKMRAPNLNHVFSQYDSMGQARFPDYELREKVRKVANIAAKKGLKLYVIDKDKEHTEEVDPAAYRDSLYIRPSLLKRYRAKKDQFKKAA